MHMIPSRFQIIDTMEENLGEQTIHKTHTQSFVFHKVSLCFLCKHFRSTHRNEGSTATAGIRLIMQDENIFATFLPGVTLLSLNF